jgi:hypothetical protein
MLGLSARHLKTQNFLEKSWISRYCKTYRKQEYINEALALIYAKFGLVHFSVDISEITLRYIISQRENIECLISKEVEKSNSDEKFTIK